MEVCEKALSFSTSLSDTSFAALIGVDDPTSLIDEGLTLPFAKMVSNLCLEICTLLEMEERISPPQGTDDMVNFLFDLSTILGELDCGYEAICCGPLENRFDSAEKRALLINYLVSEMRCARLSALQRLNTPIKTEVGDKEGTQYIRTAMNTLGITLSNSASQEPATIITDLHRAANERLLTCATKPTPLFQTNKPIDLKRADAIQRVVNTLSQDIRSRNLLLLKRLDVTVNSFLWADRVRKQEDTIHKLFSTKREEMSKISCGDVASILAAGQDLLRIEQASAVARREKTRSKEHPLTKAERPQDRGGRTGEIAPQVNETFRQQQYEKEHPNRGRGGPRRGGGRGRGDQGFQRGNYHGGQNQPQQYYQQTPYQSHEQQVQNEYQQRENVYYGRGRGGGNRGRGRGRGERYERY